jgi:hypothetical protein
MCSSIWVANCIEVPLSGRRKVGAASDAILMMRYLFLPLEIDCFLPFDVRWQLIPPILKWLTAAKSFGL